MTDHLRTQIEAELQLAIALGWTNLVDAGRTLVGTPPGGGTNSRGQAAVPRWTRDWNACGPLLSAYNMALDVMGNEIRFVIADFGTGDYDFVHIAVPDWPTQDDALRYAITVAAEAKLSQTRACPSREKKQ